MEWSNILPHVDHTLLSVTATESQIQALCADAIACKVASVCVPPNRVLAARQACGNVMRVATVIGFPNGYMTEKAKCAEAEDALQNGADELDLVIPVGFLKEGRTDALVRELKSVKQICNSHILKVIVETCLLTENEKLQACDAVARAGTDFIKTSTGFSTGGATVEDICLFRKHLPEHIRIKAAGGISTKEDAEALLLAGADRLGSSRLVRLALQQAYGKEGTIR